ncbi:SDR family NAD(P)-dependent oxidoreductase [Humibacillus xanthopallidus]|nr:SDR family NAD(P)-dependent oxidoreductase [Humibacillus xanthopallidus]
MTQSDTTSSAQGPQGRPTVLLTGPTSGIGEAAFQQLLEHPSRPSIVLLGRDRDRLESAASRARSLGLTAHAVIADLADLDSVDGAVEVVRGMVTSGDIPPIDVAVLNAGLQRSDRHGTSTQGYELTFAVNVLAQHALLRGIEEALGPRAHVVLMGSSTHRGKRASFGLVPDPQWAAPDELATPATGPRPGTREPGGTAYATSKLALVTLSHDWAERLGASGRRLNVYDPGLVAGTGLGREMRPYEYWVWRRVMPALSLLPGATTRRRTARHLVSLALGDTHASLRDGYVEIGRVTRAEAITFDPARRRDLWQWCEEALRNHTSRQRT